LLQAVEVDCVELTYIGSKINNIERLRQSNLAFYRVLSQKRHWNSITELAQAYGKSLSRTHDMLRKFELDGAIELKRRSSTEILLTERFRDYERIWERYQKLKGLLRIEVLGLVERYPYNYVALLLGYSGNHRGYNLRATLEKIGWLEGES
jgi:hypothetical protein